VLGVSELQPFLSFIRPFTPFGAVGSVGIDANAWCKVSCIVDADPLGLDIAGFGKWLTEKGVFGCEGTSSDVSEALALDSV
jgi:hypothetical protein